MSDSLEERTEQPTPRRRLEARRQGHVARSSELSTAAMMLAVAACIAWFGTELTQAAATMIRSSLSRQAWHSVTSETVTRAFADLSWTTASAAAPVVAIIAVAVIVVNVTQVGFLFSPTVIEPRLDRLNPLAGARRMLSRQTWFRMVLNVGKLAVLAAVTAWSISSLLSHILRLMEAEPSAILFGIQQAAQNLAFKLAGTLMAVALADFAFQRWMYARDLRMTRQQVREETKESEGDPDIRRRLREARQALASVAAPAAKS